jgi:hypothetical protein
MKQPATNDSADDPKQDIAQQAFAAFVDDLAAYEAGDESEDNPRNE